MSWGERSCKKPCRAQDKCSMETCNVDCIGYQWDMKTEPDSEPRGIKIPVPVNEDKRVLNALAALGLMSSRPNGRIVAMSGPPGKPQKVNSEKLIGIDIEQEYRLIQEKRSSLPATVRKKVVQEYDDFYQTKK